MIALAAFVAGAVVAGLLWCGVRGQFGGSPVLLRENHRGRMIPVAAGIVVPLAAVGVVAVYAVVTASGGRSAVESARLADAGVVLLAAVGYALLGLFDDLAGAATVKGFGGHLGALRRGEVTSGMVKLVGGVVVAVVVASLLDDGAADGPVGLGRAALVVAASANLANLFDRAPGRVIKVSLLAVPLVAGLGAPAWHLAAPLLVLGAGAGMLLPDLRERCMLGDTGANVLGAAAGIALVGALGPVGEWVALAIVVALNLVSEVVSFSRVIERVPPLRLLDRLGRIP